MSTFLSIGHTRMWPVKHPCMGNMNATINQTVLQAQKLGGMNLPLVSPQVIADYLEVQGHNVSSSPEQVFMGIPGNP